MEKKAKILVLDDDRDIGIMLKMMLEYKGYAVDILQRDEHTEVILHEKGIDLLILDMLIAGVNGTDVCRRLKKDITIAHVPIIMISALPDAETICLQAGANDFVSKPFDIQFLLSRIDCLLKRDSNILVYK